MTDDRPTEIISKKAQRTIVRAVLGMLLTLIVTLTALWFIYVDAPSPEEVCEHIIELTYAEGAEHDPESVETLVTKLRDGCVASKRQIIQYRGKIQWATYARCVFEASDLAGAEGC